MKKIIIYLLTILFVPIFLISCNSNNSSSKSSSNNYEHYCSHCSKGFNGPGFIKDSNGDTYNVPSSEVESFPAHYCSKSCALMD